FIASLIRLARLIDIPATLMVQLQSLEGESSSILRALLASLPNYETVEVLGMILHIKQAAWEQFTSDAHAEQQLKAWLSTFYTAVLSDMVLTQDEYDILTLLAYIWLGKRQLVD
ncbi:MAG: hypothetical protein Q4P13_08200, partial [Psychrobacter sp.]|nr:hypothetical protein [Psychrobacter sp.]